MCVCVCFMCVLCVCSVVCVGHGGHVSKILIMKKQTHVVMVSEWNDFKMFVVVFSPSGVIFADNSLSRAASV